MTALQRPAPPQRQPGSRREPVLRAVERPVRRPRDRRLLAVVAGGLLFATVLGGNVGVQAETTQGQFELERLRAATRQRRAHYQQLRLRVAELEAPQRILERARQLGLVEPATVTYLTPTSTTTSRDPDASRSDPAPTGEAAASWGHVKPHLDGRR